MAHDVAALATLACKQPPPVNTGRAAEQAPAGVGSFTD
jgi:hypothetical protein